MHCLNLGSGIDFELFIYLHKDKLIPSLNSVDMNYHTVEHVDLSFDHSCDEKLKYLMNNKQEKVSRLRNTFKKYDVFEFLQNYKKRDVDFISASRFFEHIKYDRIGELLYLLYGISRPSAQLSIIVPDYNKVFETLSNLDLESNPIPFQEKLIQIHTEVFNEISDPHRSIWNEQLAYYYITMEHYWDIKNIDPISLDGRDWYLQIDCERINHDYTKNHHTDTVRY